MKPLISAAALQQLMELPQLVLIDARNGKHAVQQYTAGHLKGALHVSLEKDLSQPENAAHGGRHPLPGIQTFSALLGKLGINPASHVVVYDDKNGANAAARFWWMLKAAGHDYVQVLDGGWDAAVKAGISVTKEISVPERAANYPVTTWKLPTVSMEEVSSATSDPAKLIIDVREGFRYLGESEPIDLVAGHIPNAVNIPYLENLDAGGNFLPVEKIKEKYDAVIGNHEMKDVFVHCGSGVTACHTLLALEEAGLSGANLYVGSWSEWSRNNKPVATGK
jgi:thiosulfate/3-mercaptopyruvate sulfurtransferase